MNSPTSAESSPPAAEALPDTLRAEPQLITGALENAILKSFSSIATDVDPLMTTDPASVIPDVYKQTEARTGRSRDELIGVFFRDCFTDSARAGEGISVTLEFTTTKGRGLNTRSDGPKS